MEGRPNMFIPAFTVLCPRLNMIQEILVHHIYNTAVHKMQPKLHTSQFWPLSLEVWSHVFISSPPVPPPTPLSHLHNSRTMSFTWKGPVLLSFGRVLHTTWHCWFVKSCGYVQWQLFWIVLYVKVDSLTDTLPETDSFLDKREGEYLNYVPKCIAKPWL